MMTTHWKFAVLLVTLWLPTALTSAQWDASTQEGTSTTTATAAPTPPDQIVSTTPQPSLQEPQEKKGLDVSFTWGLSIGVPIVLNVPHDVVRPGANINFFAGADFGWFVLGGDTGLQWTPVDLNGFNANGVILSGRHPLTRIYLTLPEVRFQIPDLKVVMPYISGAFDMNFWNFAETDTSCGGINYWYCGQYSVYRFTPGFTGKAGVAFEVKGGVYIDAGFQYSFTGKGNFFADSGWWLSPYVGVLVRRR